MSKVYFSEKIERIVEKLDVNLLGNKVGIKVHFGEKGCNTYLDPEIVRKVYAKIKKSGKEVSLIECNVLYRGSRTLSSEHIKTAKEHGFDFAPIDILDGEKGEEYIELDAGGLAGKAKVGRGLSNFDSLVVISHFKGHMAAGYGGAIKNLGMGLGSRAGKLHMHSNIKPSVIIEKCVACELCIANCNSCAISLRDGKAYIDSNRCVGCAMCIAVCPNKAIRIPWEGSTSEELQKKMVDYCYAIKQYLPRMIFINVLMNITKNCDCRNWEENPITEDIGFLLSNDMVAIDQASFDLVENKMGGRFSKINEIPKDIQTSYGEERGLGSRSYELIQL